MNTIRKTNLLNEFVEIQKKQQILENLEYARIGEFSRHYDSIEKKMVGMKIEDAMNYMEIVYDKWRIDNPRGAETLDCEIHLYSRKSVDKSLSKNEQSYYESLIKQKFESIQGINLSSNYKPYYSQNMIESDEIMDRQLWALSCRSNYITKEFVLHNKVQYHYYITKKYQSIIYNECPRRVL